MNRRDAAAARARDEVFRSYVREAAGTGGAADDLAKLADLRDRGVATGAEFSQQKAKILS